MIYLIKLLIAALDIYFWLITAAIVMSWLVTFGVMNTRNQGVYKLVAFLTRVTEPVMRRIRQFIPPVGGIDLSPMVVIFAIYFLQQFLYGLMY